MFTLSMASCTHQQLAGFDRKRRTQPTCTASQSFGFQLLMEAHLHLAIPRQPACKAIYE